MEQLSRFIPGRARVLCTPYDCCAPSLLWFGLLQVTKLTKQSSFATSRLKSWNKPSLIHLTLSVHTKIYIHNIPFTKIVQLYKKQGTMNEVQMLHRVWTRQMFIEKELGIQHCVHTQSQLEAHIAQQNCLTLPIQWILQRASKLLLMISKLIRKEWVDILIMDITRRHIIIN